MVARAPNQEDAAPPRRVCLAAARAVPRVAGRRAVDLHLGASSAPPFDARRPGRRAGRPAPGHGAEGGPGAPPAGRGAAARRRRRAPRASCRRRRSAGSVAHPWRPPGPQRPHLGLEAGGARAPPRCGRRGLFSARGAAVPPRRARGRHCEGLASMAGPGRSEGLLMLLRLPSPRLRALVQAYAHNRALCTAGPDVPHLAPGPPWTWRRVDRDAVAHVAARFGPAAMMSGGSGRLSLQSTGKHQHSGNNLQLGVRIKQ